MSQIIRRGGRAVLPYSKLATLTLPQARAVNAALTAYRYRKPIFQGMKMAYSGVKRFRNYRKSLPARKRQRIFKKLGRRPGSATAKKAEVIIDTTSLLAMSTRTLYTLNLVELNKQSAEEIDRRDRDIANIRGVKICLQFDNQDTNNYPMYVNVAIVSPKDINTTPLTTEFFRGYGTTRYVNFDNSLSALSFHCRPINTDLYDVVMHKRLKLGPRIDDTSSMPNAPVKTLMRYIKINRQFSYDGENAQPVGRNLYMCMWCDEADKLGGSLVQVNKVNCMREIVLYFREPKC